MSFPRFIALLLLVLGAAPAFAAELLGPAQVVPVSPTSVTVRWSTDVPTGTRISYGLSAEAVNQHAEGTLTDAHEVTLTGLHPGTKYFFTVGTARKKIGAGDFITASSASAATAPPSTSPVAKSSASTPAPAAAPARPKPRLPGLFTKPANPPAAKAPPTRATWANVDSLPDHFARHGADFAAKDADDYAQMAWEFRERAKAERLPTKVDEAGVLRVFDPKTGTFAAYNRDGTTKTFFKPGGRGYFERQPGRVITP